MILDQIVAFKNGHLASAFSCVEILLTLYHGVLNVDPSRPHWPDRDRFILSKGHGVSVLYAILADLGFFPQDWLTAAQEGNALGGHADRKVPGIDWSTGSLGHGLSVATGMALAAKMDRKDYRVFCLLGDGELQEGAVWEAAMFAGHHQLKNLVVLVDYNRSQSCGPTSTIVDVGCIHDKFSTFGWYSLNIDGHDPQKLHRAFDTVRTHRSAIPRALIAHTTKGKGVSFIETGSQWHTSIPTKEELLAAKRELGVA